MTPVAATPSVSDADGAHPLARWAAHFTPDDIAILETAGYGARMGFGASPALIVVDVTYAFTGYDRRPRAEAIKLWRRACGPSAWHAVDVIESVLAASRRAGIPICFTRLREGPGVHDDGLWSQKNFRRQASEGHGGASAAAPDARDGEIVAELRPRSDELVLEKTKPSAFFGTDLLPYLIARHVDSVLICGGVTSGCVYQSAVDAFAHNLKAAVIEDGCFDRVVAPHWAALLDIDCKYGDVVDSATVNELLQSRVGAEPSAGQSSARRRRR